MSDPYASVAAIYDLMVDWPTRLAREHPFFTRLYDERTIRRVLDVGCGTGHHTQLFAKLGAEAIGIDPSVPMITHARALTTGDNPRFVEGGFAEIPTMPGPFDLITILGNTLAYVDDVADMARTIGSVRQQLDPAGQLVIQVVNYDSLRTQGERRLPIVNRRTETREYLFLREYRMLGDAAEFTLIILIRNGETWQQEVERSRHYPMTGEMLRATLEDAGFTRTRMYGDYQGAAYDPASSPSLVIVAEIG